MAQDVGPMALLDVQGVHVLVTSRAAQTLDTSPFELHGIDVRTYDIIGIKSAVHFRAGFRHLVHRILPVDAPGLSTTCTEMFSRTRQKGALWGKDPDCMVQYKRSDGEIPTTY